MVCYHQTAIPQCITNGGAYLRLLLMLLLMVLEFAAAFKELLRKLTGIFGLTKIRPYIVMYLGGENKMTLLVYLLITEQGISLYKH